MSPEKQKPQNIIDEGRVWPFYESSGIPILPRKTRCIGVQRCPAVKRKGFCHPKSGHHLLFEKGIVRSLGHPYDLLVDHPLLKVPMAECRHNNYESGSTSYAIHAQYDEAHIPDREVAYKFIDEGRLLMSTLASAEDLRSMRRLLSVIHSHKKPINDRNYVVEVAHSVHKTTDMLNKKLDQFDEFEVMPERMVMRAINVVMQRRAEIRGVFALEPRVDITPIRDVAMVVGLARVA